MLDISNESAYATRSVLRYKVAASMQDALTPDRGHRPSRASPSWPALVCMVLLLGSCGDVVDVSDRVLCGPAGYRMRLPTVACEPALLQLCTSEEVGPSTRMEPLDCREGVGYLDNPGIMHTRCESALEGHSGEACGAEFMCARHDDDSCCFEFVTCRLAQGLRRSRVCAESCASTFALTNSLSPALPQTRCADLLPFAPDVTTRDLDRQVFGCAGSAVCSAELRDLTVAQPLASGVTTAYLCSGNLLRRVSFMEYSFAPTVSSHEPPILSAKRPGAAD